MAVVFDTTMLLILIDPKALVPADPDSGVIPTEARRRLNHLVAQLQKDRQKILIPTPVLAELVWLAEKEGPEYVARFNKYGGAFQIVDFDQKAAIELALMTAKIKRSGDAKAGSTESMAKLKFDRQIVAIAKVNKATAIYACDRGLINFAKNNGIQAIKLSELELPPKDKQAEIEFPDEEPRQSPSPE